MALLHTHTYLLHNVNSLYSWNVTSDYSELSDAVQTVEWNDDADDSQPWLMPNNSSIGLLRI